jgi:mannose-6-phosphate isomerase-like protein (cupin superfamily)
MNSIEIRTTFVIIVSVLFGGSLFVQGCAMDHKNSRVSSGKVLIMDLNDNPEYQPLLVGEPQTCGMRSGRVYLQPGESCGQHSTKAHEEQLVFLSGKGLILIGNEETPYEVEAGEVCYIPPHTMHNNKNTGTEPLVYIYCVAPVNNPD